jgi:succinate dehydrogenase flavin-adding protein (antitoxin of CptAB toxin-antitoxin module)
MFKFADDTNLLIPQISEISAKAEILNIKSWAFENQMEINWDKTTELVFRRPNLNQELLPDSVCNIEQVLEARLLGVIISGKFAFHAHVKYLLSVCSQRLYLLKLLRQQGLPRHELNIVYSAIIVNRLTYALPAWAGFLTTDLTSRLNSLLKKCFKCRYSKKCNNISQLIEQADDKLFASLNKPEHCAHYLLPPIKPSVRSLRSRGHKYTLPKCKYNLLKNLFIY